MVIVANVTGFGATVCNAQIDGAAPLPEIKKSAGPSLEETKQWISEKLSSLLVTQPSRHGKYESQARQVVSFDDCEMTLTRASTIKDNEKWTINTCHVYNMQLQDIDVDTMSITNNYISDNTFFFSSLGGLKIIKEGEIKVNWPALERPGLTLSDFEIIDRFPVKSADFKSGHFSISGKTYDIIKSSPSGGTYIIFPDIEIAERMSIAFKHAVMLCQQKVAKEKVAQPPRNKELF